MFSRGLIFAGALLCLVQLSAPFTLNPPKSVLVLPSKRDGVLPQCTFEGNTDFYGIGVRVGFYCQWFANLIAFVFNPKGCEELSTQQTIFLLANLIAVVVLQNTAADETNAVVPILLFYMFFGSSITAVTSATASLEAWDDAIITKKISKLAKHAFVQLTYIGTLIHSFYFWTEGFKKFKVFPPECGGTFVFPYHVRLSLDSPSVGTVLALLLLVLFYLTVWLIAYKRLRRSFGPNAPLPKSKWSIHGGKEHDQYPPWDRRQLPWTILGGTLILGVIIYSIVGSELTMNWNKITNVNYLGNTGQLIPFIIGIFSLPTAIWGAIENWRSELHKTRELKRRSTLEAKAAVPDTPSTPFTPGPFGPTRTEKEKEVEKGFEHEARPLASPGLSERNVRPGSSREIA